MECDLSNLILGFSILGVLVAPIVAAILVFRQSSWPISLGWLGMTAAAVCFAVLSALPPESGPVGLADYYQLVTNLRIGLGLTLTFGFGAVALVVSIGCLLTPGPDAAVDRAGLLRGLLGALLGAVLGAGLVGGLVGADQVMDAGPVVMLLPPLSVLATIGAMLMALRTSADADHIRRVAGLRAVYGLVVLLALFLFGEFWVGIGMMLTFGAVASASAEARQTLAANGVVVSLQARWIAMALSSMPAFAAWAIAMPSLPNLQGRQRLGVVVASAQAALILAAFVSIGLMPA